MREERNYAEHLQKRLKNTQNLLNGLSPILKNHAQELNLPDFVKLLLELTDLDRVPSVILQTS